MSVLRVVGRSFVFGVLAAGGMVIAVRVIDPVASLTPFYETVLGFGALVFCYAVLNAMLAQTAWALMRRLGRPSDCLSVWLVFWQSPSRCPAPSTADHQALACVPRKL